MKFSTTHPHLGYEDLIFSFELKNVERQVWSNQLIPVSVVYYESRKRELKIRLMNEGRYDERLKARVEESTCLTYSGLHDKTN